MKEEKLKSTSTIKCGLKHFFREKSLRKKIKLKTPQLCQLATETMHLIGLDVRCRYEM